MTKANKKGGRQTAAQPAVPAASYRLSPAILDLSATSRYNPKAPLLSACMIVKDEEATLRDCLKSLSKLVDEVVIYDTGSTDGTVALARKLNARVYEGYWDDDFARARNAALEQCQGDWIMWIDADERFVCQDPRELRAALEVVGQPDALLVEIRNLMGDGSQMGNIHRAFRLFRRERCRWYGQLHEQVDLRPEFEGAVKAVPLEGAHLTHLGYTDDIMRDRDKLARNLRLARAVVESGECKPGQEGVAELNLGRSLSALGRPEEGQPYLEMAAEKCVEGAPRRAAYLYLVHNLGALQRNQEAVVAARALADMCTEKGLPRYLEAANLRRLGQSKEAVEILSSIKACRDEDGFALPDYMVRAELAGALYEVGRTGEAADQLVLIIEQNPDIAHLTAALRVFAISGKDISALVKVMPEDRLDRVAAALLLVPPALADEMAEALWARFGARPQLLAAAIRFAPLLPVTRALDWSARLRAIGMTGACPLISQARMELLDPLERLRAAVSAHAAFGEGTAADLAVALMPGIPERKLGLALAEAGALDPGLLPRLTEAARLEAAPGLYAMGTPQSRSRAVDTALAATATAPAPAAIAAF